MVPHFAALLEPFGKVFASNEFGRRKPDAGRLCAVVAGIGVPAQRVLFFDDAASNVQGARACGLRAVQVTSTADIERSLADIGL